MNVDELNLRTLPQLIEIATMQLSGGQYNIDGTVDPQYIETMLILLRSTAIRNNYTGSRYVAANKTIPSICIQDYHVIYDDDLQDDPCWNKFYCPEVISLDDKFDGLRYVGTEDDTNAFYRVKNASQYASMLNDPILKRLMEQNIVYMYTATDNILKVNDKDLRSFKVRGIFTDPTVIPTYNKNIDPFPCDINTITTILNELYAMFTKNESATPSDAIADGKDESGIINANRK